MTHASSIQLVTTLPAMPLRADDAHKGSCGRVTVVAGSRGMAGAACLCATAALRGGAGLVTAAVPDGIVPILAGFEPSYLTLALSEDSEGRIRFDALARLNKALAPQSSVAIGPGLGQSAELRMLVGELYANLPLPLVVDADALNLLAKDRRSNHCRIVADAASIRTDAGSVGHDSDCCADPKSPESLTRSAGAAPRVLTPHPGEFSRLTGLDIATVQQDRTRHAIDFARQHRIVVVLKGRETVITDGGRLAINTTGNSGMATGGTGDVLTGLIAALLAQGMEPFDAAQLGVHVHGLAGDLAAEELSKPGMIASDLLRFIGRAWCEMGL